MRVRTDVLDVEIGLAGGELQRADLVVYPLVKGEVKPPAAEQNVYHLRERAVGAFERFTGLAADPARVDAHFRRLISQGANA